MEGSKYGRYRRIRLPRHRRSRVQDGAFEDRNVWYKCWNCGFVFDVEATSINAEVDGRYYTEADYSGASPKLSDDQYALPDYGRKIYLHNVASGCPLCATNALP